MRLPLVGAEVCGSGRADVPRSGGQYLSGVEPWLSARRAAPLVPTLLGHVVACSYCRRGRFRIEGLNSAQLRLI